MKRIILGIFVCLMIVISTLSLIVSANSPPSKPEIEGPSDGITNTEYEFKFCSSDPDGDEITYCVDWGDGVGEVCLGPFPSGACITEKHTWSSEATFTIKVKARDTNDAESETATHSITLPKNKIINGHPLIISRLIERYPILLNLLLI
jgi:hypothetical protein